MGSSATSIKSVNFNAEVANNFIQMTYFVFKYRTKNCVFVYYKFTLRNTLYFLMSTSSECFYCVGKCVIVIKKNTFSSINTTHDRDIA